MGRIDWDVVGPPVVGFLIVLIAPGWGWWIGQTAIENGWGFLATMYFGVVIPWVLLMGVVLLWINRNDIFRPRS